MKILISRIHQLTNITNIWLKSIVSRGMAMIENQIYEHVLGKQNIYKTAWKLPWLPLYNFKSFNCNLMYVGWSCVAKPIFFLQSVFFFSCANIRSRQNLENEDLKLTNTYFFQYLFNKAYFFFSCAKKKVYQFFYVVHNI